MPEFESRGVARAFSSSRERGGVVCGGDGGSRSWGPAGCFWCFLSAVNQIIGNRGISRRLHGVGSMAEEPQAPKRTFNFPGPLRASPPPSRQAHGPQHLQGVLPVRGPDQHGPSDVCSSSGRRAPSEREREHHWLSFCSLRCVQNGSLNHMKVKLLVHKHPTFCWEQRHCV